MISNDRRPAPRAGEYDPFVRGRFPVGVRTTQALDSARNRLFPCEIWNPAPAHYAGYDFRSGTRATFPFPQRAPLRTRMPGRAAEPKPGTNPLSFFSLPTAGP